MIGLGADDLGVHRTGVDDIALRDFHLHLGDEGQPLVRLGLEVTGDPLALVGHVSVDAQSLEFVSKRRLGAFLADGDPGQRVSPARRAVLER